jgi:hypothetical protein
MPAADYIEPDIEKFKDQCEQILITKELVFG